MIRFECDYLEGAHPRILERLTATNMEQTPGYSLDSHCAKARYQIQHLCENSSLDVHFLVGGTQTNTTVIAAALRPHQGVIAADTGHINVHETGAIEAAGHKVIVCPGRNGKLTAGQVWEKCFRHFSDPEREHGVQPRMVYISHPTENGTLYTFSELKDIHDVCREFGLKLFLDGARLGYGLAAHENFPEEDRVALPDIARLCDVFYIGGTKVGALFGEAVVISDPELKKDFRYHIKQHGGMLAKGRLLGIQFETLFEDGLYFDISRRAVKLALEIKAALISRNIPLLFDSPTNQQYPILPDDALFRLSEKYSFSTWEKVDPDHTAVRICTSWATTEENVAELIGDIMAL